MVPKSISRFARNTLDAKGEDCHRKAASVQREVRTVPSEFLPGMRLAMDRALAQNNSPRVAEIDARSEELQKELLKKANAKQGFEEPSPVSPCLHSLH
ncbi:MAG: hypothetical protein IJI25_06675 [Eubacterium sp.]|nr:hypothetical protein [Eubacterium sp.]